MSFRLSVFVLALCGPASVLTAQTAVEGGRAVPPPGGVSAIAPSVMLQPSLDAVERTMPVLRVEKWKGSGDVRQETMANLSSIQRDIETTLPALLATADTGPETVTKLLPAYRNIEALYDVLLRVAEVGRITAPRDQSAALAQALLSLEQGRRDLGDKLHTAAVGEEMRVSALEAKLKAVPPPAPRPEAVAVPVCKPAPVRRRRRTVHKTVKKPEASTHTAPAAAH